MERADRLSDLPSYPFASWAEQVADARRRGRDVIRLDVGNPDMPPPNEIIKRLCRSARQLEKHGYPGYRGIRAFREAVVEYYRRRFGVVLDPDSEVVLLIGSKEGLVNLALAYLNPGDLALVPDPGYAPYARGTVLAGAEVYTFALQLELGFLPDLAAIPDAVADRARLMWLNYPNNPTGGTADLDFFVQAVDFARRHDLLLCHDAPYCDVTYGDYMAPSLLEVEGASEVAVEFNSLSKTFNMAGWRLGMAVGNADVLAGLARLKSNVDSGAFRPLQEAAAAALAIDPLWITSRNAAYEERMNLVAGALDAAGFEVTRPRATLYFWVPVPSAETSEAFALRLLNETGVAVAPGSFFGAAGEGYVRVSITAPSVRLRHAMDRLRAFDLVPG